jgi:membrane-associated protease RseP (regulator of RpoE activity)
MKIRLPYLIPGILLLVLGLLWALQGAGMVGGSPMTGQRVWLVIGIVAALAGLAAGYRGLSAR